MSNEHPNHNSRWRDKLEEMAHVPGEPFNKDMAWDKLYGRLREGRKNKKVLWYWIAAACVVIAVVFSVLSYYSKDGAKLPENKIAISHPAKPTIVPPALVRTNTLSNHEIHLEAAGKRIAVNPRFAKTKFRIDIVGISKPPTTGLPDVSPQIAPPTHVLHLTDSPPIASTSTARKKLEVVHINELGDPIPETFDLVGKSEKYLKMKLAKGEILASPSFATKNTGFPIVTIKTASN
jgi:hypothetical protein